MTEIATRGSVIVGGMRRCTRCEKVLPLAKFYRHSQQSNTTHSACKVCEKAQAVIRIKAAPSKTYEVQRRSRLKRQYGLSWPDFLALLHRQEYGCAICTKRFDPTGLGRDIYVDHDHGTGAVRGLLCLKCNSGLGAFRDDAITVERAAAYLRRGER